MNPNDSEEIAKKYYADLGLDPKKLTRRTKRMIRDGDQKAFTGFLRQSTGTWDAHGKSVPEALRIMASMLPPDEPQAPDQAGTPDTSAHAAASTSGPLGGAIVKGEPGVDDIDDGNDDPLDFDPFSATPPGGMGNATQAVVQADVFGAHASGTGADILDDSIEMEQPDLSSGPGTVPAVSTGRSQEIHALIPPTVGTPRPGTVRQSGVHSTLVGKGSRQFQVDPSAETGDHFELVQTGPPSGIKNSLRDTTARSIDESGGLELKTPSQGIPAPDKNLGLDATMVGAQYQDPTQLAPGENSPDLEQLVGAKIAGNLTIVKRLGHGAQGVVYLAEHSVLKTKRVVKFLKSNESTAINKFLREAQLTLQAGPNVAKALDFGVYKGAHWFTMEHFQGDLLEQLDVQQVRADPTERNLWSRLGNWFAKQSHRVYLRSRLGPELSGGLVGDHRVGVLYSLDDTWGPAWSAEVVRVIAASLYDAHQNGIIHLDIKPQNFMVRWPNNTPNLDAEGKPIRVPIRLRDLKRRLALADFGLAVMRDKKVSGDEVYIEESGCGTPLYLSPEQVSQIDGNKNIVLDARTDIYQLGVVLYYLQTGSFPFPGKSLPEIMMNVMEARPIRAREMHDGIDDDLDHIIHRMIAHRPEDRYQSAKAAALDLENWLNYRVVEGRDSLRHHARKSVRRNSPWIAAAALIGTLVTGGAAWLNYKLNEAQRQQFALQQEAERKSQEEQMQREAIDRQVGSVIERYQGLPQSPSSGDIALIISACEGVLPEASVRLPKQTVDRLREAQQSLSRRLQDQRRNERLSGIERDYREYIRENENPQDYAAAIDRIGVFSGLINAELPEGQTHHPLLAEFGLRVQEFTRRKTEAEAQQRRTALIEGLAASSSETYARAFEQYTSLRGTSVTVAALGSLTEARVTGAATLLRDADRATRNWYAEAPRDNQAVSRLRDLELALRDIERIDRESHDLRNRQEQARDFLTRYESARAQGQFKQALMHAVSAYALNRDEALLGVIPELIEEDKRAEQTSTMQAILTQVVPLSEPLQRVYFDQLVGDFEGSQEIFDRVVVKTRECLEARLRGNPEPGLDAQTRSLMRRYALLPQQAQTAQPAPLGVALSEPVWRALLEAYDGLRSAGELRAGRRSARDDERQIAQRGQREREYDLGFAIIREDYIGQGGRRISSDEWRARMLADLDRAVNSRESQDDSDRQRLDHLRATLSGLRATTYTQDQARARIRALYPQAYEAAPSAPKAPVSPPKDQQR